MSNPSPLREIAELDSAIDRYAFPCVAYDFRANRELSFSTMRGVESYIGGLLQTDSFDGIKAGLSNVLYWGHARTGYRNIRVTRFRSAVTTEQLAKAKLILSRPGSFSIKNLADVRMPEFSGMSFLTKAFMFCDPRKFVVLDLKLASLRFMPALNVFQTLKLHKSATSLPPTPRTMGFYFAWCGLCESLAEQVNRRDVRAVEVERGFFQLVDEGKQQILAKLLDPQYVANLTNPQGGSPMTPGDRRRLQVVEEFTKRQQLYVLEYIRGLGFNSVAKYA